MSARSLRRRLKVAICLAVACACAFLLYAKVPVEVPLQYEKWEKVARERVHKTLSAKGVRDVSNATLGVSSKQPGFSAKPEVTNGI